MMTHETTPTEPEYKLVKLDDSPRALGMVLELLSRHPPFADSRLSEMIKVVRKQLRHGRNIAAVSPKNELAAYAGWVPTLRASAELWMEDRGPLKVLDQGSDALAMTVVVSESPNVTRVLMRQARDLNPDMNWYFKRSYGGQFRAPRKQGVVDRRTRGGESEGT